MAKQPAYFDSMAAAAAVLGIDVEVLREAKRQGCPAFRSGRVYRDELLRWLREKHVQKRRLDQIDARGRTGQSVIAQTIEGITSCVDLGVLTPEQSFDFCRTIVDSADDTELRELLRRTLSEWVEYNFSEIAESKARKAHPTIMSWLRSENKAWVVREYGDLIAESPVDLKVS